MKNTSQTFRLQNVFTQENVKKKKLSTDVPRKHGNTQSHYPKV